MKGRFASILLLICFVAPLATTYLILQYQKMQVKKEVKSSIIAGLDRNQLALVKLTEEESKTQLYWEHPTEFEYEGRMYDIVEKEVKGDTIFYWCWIDNEETKLNAQLENLVAIDLNNDLQRKQYREKLNNFYKTIFCDQSFGRQIGLVQIKRQTSYYAFFNLVENYAPLVPPPEVS